MTSQEFDSETAAYEFGLQAARTWIDTHEEHDNLVLSWLSVVLTVLVIGLSALLVRVALRPMPVVVVPGAAIAGVYNAGEMPETVMIHFARNFCGSIWPITLRHRRKSLPRIGRHLPISGGTQPKSFRY